MSGHRTWAAWQCVQLLLPAELPAATTHRFEYVPPRPVPPLLQRLSAQASRYQHPTGCGLQPCAAKQQQRPPTLVIYVYAAGGCWRRRASAVCGAVSW